MASVLDRSLVPDGRVMAAHAALIVDASMMPSPVREWQHQNAPQLAFSIATVVPEPMRESALRAFADASANMDVEMVRSVLYDSGEAVERFAPAQLDHWSTLLTGLARRRWGEPGKATGEGRSAALRWLRALGVLLKDPLLESGPPSPEAVQAIAQARSTNCIPEELGRFISERVVRYWPAFAEVVAKEWHLWHTHLTRFPPEFSQLLTGAMPVEEGLVPALRWLLHGGAPEGPAPDAAGAAVVSALMAQLPLTNEHRLACWRSISTPDWLLFAIRIFGGPVEEPSVAQLVGMVRYREAIARLLEESPSREMHWLRICSLGWQSADVRGPDAYLWRPEFVRTPLTGIFSGLPRENEAPFSALLNFFSECSGRTRWELALAYLERRGETARQDGTIPLLWREVVEPACLAAGVSQKQIEHLLSFSEPRLPGRRRSPRSIIEVAEDRALSEPIFVLDDGRVYLQREFAQLIQALGDPRRFGDRLEHCKKG